MRAFIPALDTASIEWTPGMLPGSFRKRLNADPETGATTGMSRFDAGAVQPPGRPHFHHVDEEIVILRGEVTFDSQTWLPAKGYCYHPVGTVHGFKSGLRGNVGFFFRNNGGAEFNLNYIEGEPEKIEWYQAFGPAEPPRSPRYIADPGKLGETARADGSFSTLLSKHPDTGEGSMFLRLPPGWKSAAPATAFGFYKEILVLEGEVLATDGNRLGSDFYAFIPPGIPHGFSVSENGALILISFGGGEP